jgi:gliding motility-associated transport system permease protein
VSITWLIARRELAAYLRTWTGYIIIAVALVVDGILFNAFALGGEKRSAEVLKDFFFYASGTTMIASLFLSMRLIAEEKQTGTLVLLTSSPIKDYQIVLGKFISGFLFLAIMTLLTAFMPALIMVNGKLSVGQIAAGYLGLLLLGSAAMAIGTLGSTLAKSQLVALIISAGMLLFMLLMWMLAAITDRPLRELFLALALYQRHFVPFQSGVVHLRDVIYYVALTYFMLFTAIRVLEARRWR